jgi:hypothetical protein
MLHREQRRVYLPWTTEMSNGLNGNYVASVVKMK